MLHKLRIHVREETSEIKQRNYVQMLRVLTKCTNFV